MAVITAVEEQSSSTRRAVLEKMQVYDGSDIDGVLSSFKKLRKCCKNLTGSTDPLVQGKRRAMPALLGPQPKTIKVCRSFARSPTEVSMPSPSAS